MDRIQPVELEEIKNTQAFAENSKGLETGRKSVINGELKPIMLQPGPSDTLEVIRGQNIQSHQYDKINDHLSEFNDVDKSTSPILEPNSPTETKAYILENKDLEEGKVEIEFKRSEIVIPHVDHILPFPTFEYLSDLSTFVMTRISLTMAEITTGSDLGLFKCILSENSYCEGCKAESLEKISTIYDFQNTNKVMQLRHTMPPCHSCFETESNRIEIFGSDDRLMATILQKKSWVGSRIDREILIEPGPYGKANTYTATFTWADASINFKANRSGIIVATLMTDCVEKGRESNYVLQFLRDICPRDKAMLVAFTVARDTLVSDECQKRQIIERITMFLIIIAFIVVCSYMFHPTSQPVQQF